MDDSSAARGCLLKGLLLLVALPVVAFTYSAFSPHLLLHPTTRYLYHFREMTNRTGVTLIPDLFSEGESKMSVQDKTTSAGLEVWSNRYGDDSNHQVFRLVAGHNLACGYGLFVEVYYDDQDKLTRANVSQGGACL